MDSAYIWSMVIGLIIVISGCLIWFKKMLFLIAGYNESSFFGNKDKLAKRAGIIIILLGIVTILFPYFQNSLGDTAEVIYPSIIIIGVVLLIFFVKRNR
ncbi:DUF3784 domain-containing protein [Peribacillus sp. NPDC097675]|uniref:DUF3784 domain-containing protein n=1 Tax=Peribacillus sp. NPDC097675 TaxID=3390618 RepID=UPI003CFDE5A3